MVASVLLLPSEADGAQVQLRVSLRGDAERWERSFDGRALSSIQRAYRGLLLERFGPYTFGFRVEPEVDGLSLVFARAWLFGIPWPSWLAVKSRARARAVDSGWHVDVVVTAPLLGLLARYDGVVEPT